MEERRQPPRGPAKGRAMGPPSNVIFQNRAWGPRASPRWGDRNLGPHRDTRPGPQARGLRELEALPTG